MAFSSGSESKEFERKLYIGVAPVYVMGVNPSKEGLSKFFGRTFEEDPRYLGVKKVTIEGEEREVPSVRLDFLIATANGCKYEVKHRMSFFLTKAPIVGANTGKVKVIDKYGRTAWATKEDVSTHAIPMYSNGPAKIDKDYRLAYRGEEELTLFIKNYLCIPEVSYAYVDKKTQKLVVKDLKNPSEAIARFDHIEDLFKGNYTEIKNAIKLRPTNRVNVMFGVRTVDSNQYQAVYTGMTAKLTSTNFDKIEKHYKDAQALNPNPDNVEYSIKPLQEYEVEATSFEEPTLETPIGSSTDLGGSDLPWED